MVTYYAQFEPDKSSGGFVVQFPDFGYGVTQAETLKEAQAMAEDLLKCLIREAVTAGQPLPPAPKHRGKQYHAVSLPALASAKTELYRAFCVSGLRKAEFARRVGIAKTNVERLFDLNHASRLDQIEAAFHALGKRLDLIIDSAA
jgi:antitoxin HicB